MTLRDKAIVFQMLELYKDMSYLWDKKEKEYNNKEMRHNGFEILLNIYKEVDAHATVRTLVKKIQNLRTNYIKEYKKAKESRENATCPDDIYTPTLWYFDALSFLEECCFGSDEQQSFSVTVVPKIELQENPSPPSSPSHPESDHQSLSETSSIIPKKKRKMTKTYQRRSVKRQDEINTDDKPLKMKDEEWEVLGKAIGIQLRDLNRKQLTVTQKIISDTIYYAKMGLLTENSYIALKQLERPEASDFSHLPSTSSYQEISCSFESSVNPLELKTSPQSSPDNDDDL